MIQVFCGPVLNGKPHRTVVVQNFDGREYQDKIDTDSGFQREALLQRAAEQFDVDLEVLKPLDREICRQAGIEDQRAESGDGKNRFKPTAVCSRADKIAPRKIRWLWPNHFALGKYNEIVGQPGVGKSVLTCDIAARVSCGVSFPGDTAEHEPGDVVLLSAEDDPEDTTVPRLSAAGAELSRIHILTAASAPDKSGIRPISLDTDVPVVDRLLEDLPKAKLLVIDPIGAYCGKPDSYKNAEVRALLMPISMMAASRGIAVVGISHFNKNGSGSAVTRGLGSIAWTAAARMSWGVVRDDDDPAVRLLLPIKCNLAADVAGLSYRIVEVDGAPVVAWSETPVTKTIDDVLGKQSACQSPKSREVIDWLRELLSGGRVPASEVWSAAKAEGHGERAVKSAKTSLRISPYQEGFGKDCVWYWQLPETPVKDA